MTLFVDGKEFATKGGEKVLTFRIPLGEETKIQAVSGDIRDEAVLHYTAKPLPQYKLNKKVAGGGNWTKE